MPTPDQKWTKEPWPDKGSISFRGQPTKLSSEFDASGKLQSDEDWERTSACVNALAGIADPSAELARLRECEKVLKILLPKAEAAGLVTVNRRALGKEGCR